MATDRRLASLPKFSYRGSVEALRRLAVAVMMLVDAMALETAASAVYALQ
jgi:hypothetical protein